MFDIITIGHFALDRIFLPGSPRTRKTLGGPPTYTSLAAKKMGAKVSVISKVGGDFPAKYVKWLREQGVDLSGLKISEDSQTTSFMLKYYHGGERDLILRSRAPPISAEDLSPSMKARAVHVSPIANEISVDLIEMVSSMTPIISLDPQGLLRRFNDDGKMSLQKMDDLSFLRCINIFKSSEKEIKALTGRESVTEAIDKIRSYGIEVAIATMGEKGSLLSFSNKFYMVPPAKSKIILDPTGAGDVFIGAFITEYLRNADPLWCTCVGAAAASFVIEKIGPKGFRGNREIYRRAAPIYEKTLKLQL
ncbi:hypothetical protein KEJ34_00685 [Candidatus Bathyarchaeota archaeon]|nr:hypothetical protein [Candidatus Bathyarchaeota archaeon]